MKIAFFTTITSTSFITTSTILTTTTTTESEDGTTTTTTAKINMDKVKFIAPDGQDQTKAKFDNWIVNPTTATNPITVALIKGQKDIDLTKLVKLTNLSVNTFIENPPLETLKLPAKTTTWQIRDASGEGSSLNSDYATAVLNAQNKLNLIEFNGFGVDSTSNAFNGSEIIDLDPTTQWDTQIKNNTQLWTTITTMMNSLGFDPNLTEESVKQGLPISVGVQDKWVAPTDENTVKRGWLQKDVVANAFNVATNPVKWWSDKTNVGSTDTAADINISTENTTSKKSYFKHNGIIWEWNLTKDASSNKITITLTPDQTTLPNVYKAKKNTGNDAYITTFRTGLWTDSTTSTTPATKTFGVPFKFNIAVKKA